MKAKHKFIHNLCNSNSIMVKKRRLSPKSVWDEAELTEAFRVEGIKEYHVQKLHRRVGGSITAHLCILY